MATKKMVCDYTGYIFETYRKPNGSIYFVTAFKYDDTLIELTKRTLTDIVKMWLREPITCRDLRCD